MTARFAVASRIDLPGVFEDSWQILRGRHADLADASIAASVWRANVARHGIPVIVRVGEVVEVDGVRRFRPAAMTPLQDAP